MVRQQRSRPIGLRQKAKHNDHMHACTRRRLHRGKQDTCPILVKEGDKNSFAPTLCRAMLCKLCRHAVPVCVCLCVSPFITFVNSVKTSNRIFKIFSPSGSQTILVFQQQTSWQFRRRLPPKEGVVCRWGMQKIAISADICLYHVM